MQAVMPDQLGREHHFEQLPVRIVSLVPSQTELLCDLGLEASIVGITKFCVHPFHLKSIKTIVGGTKQVKADRIADLKPDIIICNKEENTLEMVAELESICPVWVTDVRSIEDNYRMVEALGNLFRCRTEAQKIIGRTQMAQAHFENFMQDKPWRKTAYFIWKKPWMVAGGDNFINALLQMNRFENIYESKGRYPEVELKKMRLEGDPEIVLLSSEPYPFKEEDAFEIGRFTHHAKTVFIDGEMFSWYGSRLVKAFSYFTKMQERLS